MKVKSMTVTLFSCLLCGYVVTARAQAIRIEGSIRDVNTHQEISNVNIFIEGTSVGTTSDFAGSYVLRVPRVEEDKKIVFRHIAYEELELTVEAALKMKYVYLQPRVIPLRSIRVEEERIPRLEIEKDIPQTVSMIKARKFEARGFVDAGDLLRTDHSVQVEEEMSGKKTVSIRGGNPDDTVVLYNGIRMNRTYDNTYDLSLIDLQDVERFEIIKGSNTALYGPEAFSGVINIVPKMQYDYNVRFQQRLGTYQSGNWGLHLYNKFRGLHGSYSIKQGGSTRKFMGDGEENAELENTSLHHTANLSYSFSELPDGRPENFLGATYTHTKLNYDNRRDVEELSNFNELLSLKYNGNIGKFRDVDFSVSLSRFEEVQSLASSRGQLNRSVKDRTIHVNTEKHFKFGITDLLVAYQFKDVRFDFVDDRGSLRGENMGLESAEFERRHHGLVSIGKLNGKIRSGLLHRVDVDVSLRYDYMKDEQHNPVLRGTTSEIDQEDMVGFFGENIWKETMFKFALHLSGGREDLSVNSYLSFGKNTKFPSLLQQISSPSLLASGPYRANLNPEKNNSTEISVTVAKEIRGHRAIDGWQLSGNFFNNYYDNKFRVFSTPGIPVPFYDNVQDAHISGFESKSSVYFFRKKITMALGISRYFISEKAAFPFKSDLKYTVSLIIDHAGYSFEIYWFKEGDQAGWIRQQSGRFSEILLPPYSNLDLHMSKTFRIGKMELFVNASGRNLLHDDTVVLQGLAIRDRRYYLTMGAQY